MLPANTYARARSLNLYKVPCTLNLRGNRKSTVYRITAKSIQEAAAKAKNTIRCFYRLIYGNDEGQYPFYVVHTERIQLEDTIYC